MRGQTSLAIILISSILFSTKAGGKQQTKKEHSTQQDHAIIFPYASDRHGNFITHELHYTSVRNLYRENSHTLRDQPQLYYKLETPHGSFHLNLEPNSGLLSSHFTVFKRTGSLRDTHVLHSGPAVSCYHHGTVLGHKRSLVALSLCDGLTGFVTTDQGDFLIQPLPHSIHTLQAVSHNQSLPHSPQPHRLYRHNHDLNTKAAHTLCGQTDGPKNRQQNMTSQRTETESSSSSVHKRRRRSLKQNSILESTDNVSTLPKSSKAASLKHPRLLETLVVVDNAMLAQHGETNVTTYVLTLLNMVSKLFSDNSIGNKINVTLVALILLEGNEPGLELGHNADKSLHNFCHWQSSLEGIHHDHAILLTGMDICSYQDEPCDTLGFAPIYGMCKRYKSCTINEDSGLGTAFTIAHETGHNLGMFHDGEGNYCTDLAGSIMAPTLAGYEGGFKWSACSRKYLKSYLRSGQAWCLDDQMSDKTNLHFPKKLPGQLYDQNTQCRWQFGPKARRCWYAFAKDVCKALWCYTGGTKCETKFLPAAEGTACGSNQWCRKGLCVKYGSSGPPPVHGEWSEFSPWSACSKTCGRGIMNRERKCNKPRPQYGGNVCDGESVMYKVCGTEECPGSDKGNYRQQQCNAYNHVPFRGWYYKWNIYKGNTKRAGMCRLFCQPEGYDFYFALSETVTDGTLCEEGRPDVCIHGMCRPVGCDNVVESGQVMDSCGVCNGDNSTCLLINDVFDDVLEPNAYNAVVLLPRGAGNIYIAETHVSRSYLAVRILNGTYAISGNWHPSKPGFYTIAGTLFHYKREYDVPESLQASGPLHQDIIIELLVHGQNPAVEYSYTFPKVVDESIFIIRSHVYSWNVTTSNCSAPCAEGKQVTEARCMRDDLEEVATSYCNMSLRPETQVKPCNTQPCPPRWEPEGWTSCSQSCGSGVQHRRITCMRRQSPTEDIRVRMRHCRPVQQPPRRRVCNTQLCPPRWHVGNWSKCSESCGSGLQRRQMQCWSEFHGGVHILKDENCDHLRKPNATQSCLEQIHCGFQWFLSAWSLCSVSCGAGLRHRSLQCMGKTLQGKFEVVNQSYCSSLPRPKLVLTENCNEGYYGCKPESQWFISPWMKCSVTCGQGLQTRMVKCLSDENGTLLKSCSEHHKPSTTKKCYNGPCPQESPCVDAYSWCHMVPRHNLCHHVFYNRNCCVACKDQS